MDVALPEAALSTGQVMTPAGLIGLLSSLPTQDVPIAELSPSHSPRMRRENAAHIRVLAETESELEPILVHRRTMHVIDGVHRLRAAARRGRTTMKARMFEGSEEDAFILSVRLNVGHGLPLTLAERRSAAIRIMTSHPYWSDRAVAEWAGISSKTVGKLRRHASGEIPQLDARIGRDGRLRPVSSAEGRRTIANRLSEDSGMSLRELAATAGVSVSTARDVRERLKRGESPVPEGRGGDVPPPGDAGAHEAPALQDAAPAEAEATESAESLPEDTEAVLRKLTRDPAFRGTESGRQLLRMLIATEVELERWRTIINNIPPHSAPLVRAIAAKRVTEWKRLAELSKSLSRPLSPRRNARPARR
ncbi:ParB N-terminal domain-containing protein [Actinomadura litoris]|uniref:ParB N-terminal domain-containing protein n=1 Tax=Actinomadura litoris TaxID=2678616 RepID=UPI001FA6DB4C|nr:ParB N-terminal domain-containing protein [Actinomadura litoris]